MIKLTEKDVTFEVSPEIEYMRIEEAFTDRDTVMHVRREVQSGNPWAYCCIKVTARWKGYQHSEYLGACSYENESDFRNDGYFTDMKWEALQGLQKALEKTWTELSELT